MVRRILLPTHHTPYLRTPRPEPRRATSPRPACLCHVSLHHFAHILCFPCYHVECRRPSPPPALAPHQLYPNYRYLHDENRAEWDFVKADVATHGLGRAGNALERLDGFDLEAAAFCESLFGVGYARAYLPL